MDNIPINSVAARKLLEKIIRKALMKKGIDLGLIFTKPIELKYDDNTKMIDADVQVHARISMDDIDRLLGG